MLRRAALFPLVFAFLNLGCDGDAGGLSRDDGGPSSDASSEDALPPIDTYAANDARPATDVRPIVDAPDVAPPMAYTEPLCNDTASLADLAAGYVDSPGGLREAANGITLRRYPMGAAVLGVMADAQLAAWFHSGTFQNVLASVEVGVRESGRAWDASMSGTTRTFRVRDDLVIHARPLNGFARGEIMTYHADPASDPYADAYLTGAAGEQGLDSLLEDYVHDTHALAAKYCTRDGIRSGDNADVRDGILTMMYYVELYLMTARMRYPAVYEAILADPGHLELIRTVWQRAEFWLNVTASHPELGVRDAQVQRWVYAPGNLLEVTRLPQ